MKVDQLNHILIIQMIQLTPRSIFIGNVDNLNYIEINVGKHSHNIFDPYLWTTSF